jgi:hypothetical protein
MISMIAGDRPDSSPSPITSTSSMNLASHIFYISFFWKMSSHWRNYSTNQLKNANSAASKEVQFYKLNYH